LAQTLLLREPRWQGGQTWKQLEIARIIGDEGASGGPGQPNNIRASGATLTDPYSEVRNAREAVQ